MKFEKIFKKTFIWAVISAFTISQASLAFADELPSHKKQQKIMGKMHKKNLPQKMNISAKKENHEAPDLNNASVKAKTANHFDLIEALNKHLSSQATLTTNYVSRGISQTLNRPALQGSATYTLDNGAYATLWGSTVKFKDTGDAVIDENTGAEITPASQDPAARAYLELDALLGYNHQFSDDLKIDLNLARYIYPNAREFNYNQANSLLTFHSVELGYQYTSNYCNTHTRSAYYILGLNYDIPSQWIKVDDVNFHATYAMSDNHEQSGYPSYHDYSAMLSKKFKMLTLGLQWTSTDGRAKQADLIDGTQWIASASIALG